MELELKKGWRFANASEFHFRKGVVFGDLPAAYILFPVRTDMQYKRYEGLI